MFADVSFAKHAYVSPVKCNTNIFIFVQLLNYSYLVSIMELTMLHFFIRIFAEVPNWT